MKAASSTAVPSSVCCNTALLRLCFSLTCLAACAVPDTASSNLEAVALRAEIDWLLKNECKTVFASVRQLLKDVSISLHEAQRSAPLRCVDPDRSASTSSDEEPPLLASAMVGAFALEAFRLQLTLPKWNNEEPYATMLTAQKGARVPLPALVTMQNRVGQAIAALGQGHASLPTARTTIHRVLVLISDAVHAVTLAPTPPIAADATLAGSLQHAGAPASAPAIPGMPRPPQPTGFVSSDAAAMLRELLTPPPPADLIVGVAAAGQPPRLCVTCTVLRPDGRALESLTVSAALDGVEERLRMLEEAQGQAARLLYKVEALAECAEESP